MSQKKDKKQMKVILWFMTLAFFASVVFFYYQTALPKTEKQVIEKSIPNFSLPSLYNSEKVITQSDLPTKPFILNVWGSWCISCKKEHSVFMKIKKSGVPVVGVNYLDIGAKAINFLHEHGNPFILNIYDNKGTLAQGLGLVGAPETFVVDEDGSIKLHVQGVIDEQKWKTVLQPCYKSLTNKSYNENNKALNTACTISQ